MCSMLGLHRSGEAQINLPEACTPKWVINFDQDDLFVLHSDRYVCPKCFSIALVSEISIFVVSLSMCLVCFVFVVTWYFVPIYDIDGPGTTVSNPEPAVAPGLSQSEFWYCQTVIECKQGPIV